MTAFDSILTKSRSVLAAVLILVPGSWILTGATARALPPWCESTPRHDAVYKNYVGRSTAVDLDRAIREAMIQAREEAVEENFGFQFHVQSTGNVHAQSDASTQSLMTQDFEERSKMVRLEGVERVETFLAAHTEPESGISACVWFRYPVQAIERERARLAGLKNGGMPLRSELVIQGSEDDARRGVVKI